MKINTNKELTFNWEKYWQYCESVSQSIKQTGKSYTQIIAIARGGFYLGDYLSRRLQIPLSVITASSYNPNNQQQELLLGKLSYIHPPNGHILLVDDLLDTGKTMVAVKKQLEDDWNIQIDTAVIWQKIKCQCKADYYYSVTPDEPWIVQPFERVENDRQTIEN